MLVSLLIGGAADLSGWHVYSPQGSGLRFAMPGTVHEYTKPDATGGCERMYKFMSAVNGITYTVVYGDAAPKYAPMCASLWQQDRTGAKVQAILGAALEGAAKSSSGTVSFKKFGDYHGFPMLAELFTHADGDGTNIFAAFTKRGVVIASARGPRNKQAAELGIQFLGSFDLSARR